jgi:CPA1 family monovalent cation:H+ antiporter
MNQLSLFNMAAIVVALAALFGWVNHRWPGLPEAIGLVVIALLAWLGVIGLDALIPGLGFRDAIARR